MRAALLFTERPHRIGSQLRLTACYLKLSRQEVSLLVHTMLQCLIMHFDNLQTQRMDNRSRQRIHRTRDILEFFLINSNFQKFKSCNGGLKYTVLGSWLNKFVNCFIRIAKNFQKINGIPNKNQTVQQKKLNNLIPMFIFPVYYRKTLVHAKNR